MARAVRRTQTQSQVVVLLGVGRERVLEVVVADAVGHFSVVVVVVIVVLLLLLEIVVDVVVDGVVDGVIVVVVLVFIVVAVDGGPGRRSRYGL